MNTEVPVLSSFSVDLSGLTKGGRRKQKLEKSPKVKCLEEKIEKSPKVKCLEEKIEKSPKVKCLEEKEDDYELTEVYEIDTDTKVNKTVVLEKVTNFQLELLKYLDSKEKIIHPELEKLLIENQMTNTELLIIAKEFKEKSFMIDNEELPSDLPIDVIENDPIKLREMFMKGKKVGKNKREITCISAVCEDKVVIHKNDVNNMRIEAFICSECQEILFQE
jgi:hypothetical protein